MVLDKGVEKKRLEIRSFADEVVRDYPDLIGLGDVFDLIWNVIGSENFKNLIRNYKDLSARLANSNCYISSASNELIKEFPQIQYVKDVFPSSGFYYLVPRRLKGDIGFNDYDSLNEIIFLVLTHNNDNNDILYEDIFNLSNRIIMLLDDFDNDVNFIGPDKEFFIKLKDLKWDEEAKKLFNKIYKVYDKFEDTCSDEVFDENPDAGYPARMGLFIGTSWKTFIFLSGCSAVHNNREIMNLEDVICAFKTYFKLLGLLKNDKKTGG